MVQENQVECFAMEIVLLKKTKGSTDPKLHAILRYEYVGLSRDEGQGFVSATLK